MKNVEIHISITAENGEWENRIVKEVKLDHSISLELLNNASVFDTVMSVLKLQTADGLDTAVNTVMRQMLVNDKDEGGSKDAGATESGNV